MFLVAADHGHITCGYLSGFDWFRRLAVHLACREADDAVQDDNDPATAFVLAGGGRIVGIARAQMDVGGKIRLKISCRDA